jgi:DNA (cytosine-5)-methyltransferase 1
MALGRTLECAWYHESATPGVKGASKEKSCSMTVPVIDVFAGPGGLSEGFARANSASFKVAVSIEKDGMAAETLCLRAAHRALLRSGFATSAVWLLWDTILADSPWNIAFDRLMESGNDAISNACKEARREVWNLEMKPDNRGMVSAGIRHRLRPFMSGRRLPDNIVLIGGPPCQAYSVVGRSRNRGTKGYRPEMDHRHFLYREYLHVISEFRPAVFVMENVKGILSSRVQDRQLFDPILEDLRRPDLASGSNRGLEYELVALGGETTDSSSYEPEDFIVQAERHGVPQARHRVIICGVRRDIRLTAGPFGKLQQVDPPSVRHVIAGLPRVCSALSYRGSGMPWAQSFDSPVLTRAIATLGQSDRPELVRVAQKMAEASKALREQSALGPGSDRSLVGPGGVPLPAAYPHWYQDRSLALLANHESRAHMPSDLVRYLFVAAFGEITRRSPKLQDFPVCLLPAHKNVDPSNPGNAIFKDRFRVQVADVHATTVTSHIAKDGHAFVHYDTMQCRSLTVREAARLQTFPDSYVFLGNRTSQYTQVGNAVPPYLAYQIAEIVGKVITAAGMSSRLQPDSLAVAEPSGD